MSISKAPRERGSALLTVLFLSAALAAIAFSLSTTVRGETERTSTAVDGLRSYYLATGGVERATLELFWSMTFPDRVLIKRGVPAVDYAFATGDVHVEIIPETSKLNVNNAPVEELYRVVAALGFEPDRARQVALAIDDWRHLSPGDVMPDQQNLRLNPSFQAPHASLQEIEELLQVRGITPEMFYGTYLLAPDNGASGGPRLIARAGLVDCLSVYGTRERVDINTAQPAVLAAIGLSPDAVNAIVQHRRTTPFDDPQLANFTQAAGAAAARLRVGGNSIYTLRATAQVRLPDGRRSDLKRTVAETVKYMPPKYDPRIHVLRWYDTAWSN